LYIFLISLALKNSAQQFKNSSAKVKIKYITDVGADQMSCIVCPGDYQVHRDHQEPDLTTKPVISDFISVFDVPAQLKDQHGVGQEYVCKDCQRPETPYG